MSHSDGVKAEKFFEQFCKKNKLQVDCIHQPFDFLVNGKLVEVKSARLFVKFSKDGDIRHGRYECWNKSQLKKLKKNDVWICFIVTSENGCMIQGFAKSKDFPLKTKISMRTAVSMGLKTTKQFLQYIK